MEGRNSSQKEKNSKKLLINKVNKTKNESGNKEESEKKESWD